MTQGAEMHDDQLVCEHIEKIATLESNMATIQHDLYGNGQPGHIAVTNDFISGLKGQFRLIVALLALIGTAVGVLTYLEANRQAHGNFTQQQPPVVGSSAPPPTSQAPDELAGR